MSSVIENAKKTGAAPTTEKIVEEEQDNPLFLDWQAFLGKVKKQPELYVNEMVECVGKFKKEFERAKEKPASKNNKFIEITMFLSQVAEFFKTDLMFLPIYLMELLNTYAEQMNPYLRLKSVIALMILRSKGFLQPKDSIEFFLKLFKIKDKNLRKLLTSHIINDIKRLNIQQKSQKLNTKLQNMMHEIIAKTSDNVTKRTVLIMKTLYKKKIWMDPKTINTIAIGCFNPLYKVKLISSFFLIETTEAVEEDSSEEDDTGPVYKEIKGPKKTKARLVRLEREKKKQQRKLKRKERLKNQVSKNFFPIDQIIDPQEFGEKLFTTLKSSNEKFEVKTCLMAVLSRLIARHKLIILSYYSFLQKYLYPHQRDIARILTFLAEACHNLIPEAELQPILKHIVDNFVNDTCSEEKITMGLNVIRELCLKTPLIMDEFHLNYLANYKSYKNKNVSSAARSIINFYREVNPKLLDKKYRGRFFQGDQDYNEILKYGRDEITETIAGADLLQKYERENGISSGEVPLCYDRVLSDADFRKIKILQRKKKEAEDMEKERQLNKMRGLEEEDDGDDGEDDEEDMEEEEDDENESSDGDDYDEDLESEMLDGEDEEGEGEGEDELEEEQEDDDKAEEENSERKVKKQQGYQKKEKGNSKKESYLEIESEELEEEEDFEEEEAEENPHGFVSVDNIASFRKTKKQRKLDLKEMRMTQVKEKAYQGPKPKKGGKTNKEKLKHKPLEMLRPKKNRENKVTMGLLKQRIRKIKVQLGHVRGEKQYMRRKVQAHTKIKK